MKKTFAALAATACLALASVSGAEIRPKSFTFSPFLGGYTFEGDHHIETDLIFGGRLGYDYTKRVGVEAVVDFGKFETTEALPRRDVRLLTFGVEGLWYFMPDRALVPFLAGGVRGVVIDDTGGTQDLERPALSYGVGAKYALAPDFALRGDVRHILLFNPNHSLNTLEYTLGLAWAFGGKAAPAPVAAPPPPPPPPPAPKAPTASLTANPVSIEAGKCTDLSWSTSNATGASIDQGVGSVATSGTKQVCPPSSTSYTLTASGPGGSATSAASVSVRQPAPPPPAAPTVSISANPVSVQQGQCTNLSWSSTNADSASIDQGVGAVTPNGSKQVCPGASTNYTITATGAGGSGTASTPVTVTVPPPPPVAPTVSISANPASVEQGQCTNLSWTSTNADSASIDQGVGAVSPAGSKQVCPGSSMNYTITATGAGGSGSASTPVTVTAPPRQPTKEELTITLQVEFDTDKDAVKPGYDGEVAKVAEFMKKYPQVKGVIEGHTDNVGGKAYNDRLSLRRANAVKKQLVEKHGIDGSRLTTAGYGFSKPVADNGTPEGRQKNRRIVANFDKVTIVKP